MKSQKKNVGNVKTIHFHILLRAYMCYCITRLKEVYEFSNHIHLFILFSFCGKTVGVRKIYFLLFRFSSMNFSSACISNLLIVVILHLIASAISFKLRPSIYLYHKTSLYLPLKCLSIKWLILAIFFFISFILLI